MSETCEAVTDLSDFECDMEDADIRNPPEDCFKTLSSEATYNRNIEKAFASIEGELDFEDETDNSTLAKPVKTDGSSESEEEGMCSPEKKPRKKDDSLEEGEDEGECTDDEQDLEEGELKEDETVPKRAARQICKFYNRNQCFFGNECRFLHLNYDHRGNYSMFATPKITRFEAVPPPLDDIMVPPLGIINPRFDFIPPESQEESAWERGLREAKDLLANKRKPVDLKEKDTERDKENVYFAKSKNHEDYLSHDYDYESKTYSDMRHPNWGRKNGQQRDVRKRPAEAFFDPWRRSKSPKRHSRSFSRSVSSYSSRSSYSRSSSSSRSNSRSPPPSHRKGGRSPERKRSRSRSSISRTPASSRSGSVESISSRSSASSDHRRKEKSPVSNQQVEFPNKNQSKNSKVSLLEDKSCHFRAATDRPKEQPIKLMLLNKEVPKKRVFDESVVRSSPPATKCSRRDELLKQLKAVEDAIARKKTKFY